MKQTPLPVSTDCIESLFGSVKHILERNPIPEFGKMILTIPLLCGIQSEEKIQAALKNVSHKKLVEWEKENTQNSMRRQKRKIFSLHRSDQQMQDPPIAKSA